MTMRTNRVIYFVRHFVKIAYGALLLFALLAGCQNRNAILSPSWQDLVPGKSTEADVISRFGKPPAQYTEGTYTVYEYPSDTAGMSIPNKIALQNGVVKLIMIHVVNNKLAESIQIYGQPERVTWPPPTACITRLFVFARHGRAVEARNLVPVHEADVSGEWYFEPMSLDRFTKEIAPAFVSQSSYCANDDYPESYWVQDK
jgi:hypothetical protein